MAKRSLQSALARKEEPTPPELTSPAPAAKRTAPDARVATSLRMPPELMIRLKTLAVRERTRVNDIIIEAIENHLAMKGDRAA